MSIKSLALELYRAQQKVERLAARLAARPDNPPAGAVDDLAGELLLAQEEARLLRRMLDDKKATASPSGLPGFRRTR